MKKKTAASPKSSRGKALPRVRPQMRKEPKRKTPPASGTLWDDDRAFRVLVKNSSDIFALIDSQGKILYRSPSVMIHLPDEKIAQSNIAEWVWPEDAEEVGRKFALILRSPGKSIPFQTRLKDETGAPLWVEGIGTNYLADPTVGAVLVNYHDITDRKQQELVLQENERRYRELFEHARLAIFQSTRDGRVLRVNPEFARMFGYDSPEDVLTSVKNVAIDLYADPARREEVIRLRAKDPRLSKFENLYRRKDGSTFWGLLNIRTVTDSGGRPLYFEGFIEDIHERKQAEQALRESAEKFRSIFENSSAGVTLTGLDRRYWMVNPSFCEMFGYTAKELLGSEFLDITHPDDVELSRKAMQGVLDGKGKTIRFVKRYLHKDGHTVWADVSAALVYGADGKPSHFVTHVIDITERKRAEEALRESEERYRSLFDNSLEGIGLSQGNQIIDANKALLEIFGYADLDEFRAIPLMDHIAPESKEFIRQRMREVGEGKLSAKRFTYKIVRKEGEVRDLEICTDHIKIGNDLYTHSTFRDITDRKRAEETLRENEERFRATFEDANVGVCIVGLDGRLLHVNREMSAIFGYSREELERMTVNSIAYPEDADISPAFMEQALSGEGKQGSFDKRYIHRDGHIVWGHISSSLVRDSLGHPRYFISHVQDITERKRAEEALQTLDSRHEALLAAIPEIVMEVDNNKVYTWANPAGIEFFGGDVIGKEAASFLEGAQDTYAKVQPLFDGSEGTIYVESWQRRKDGQKRLLAWWCRTLKNSRGEVSGALSSARDITEQRLADEQIQNLSRFPTENPNPMMRVTPEGGLLYANNASRPFLDMWRIEMGQILPEDYRAMMGEVFLSNAVKEVEVPCGERIFSCSLTPIQSAGYVNVYGRDITERKQAEEALARQAEELRQRNVELARLNDLTERQMRRLIAMRAIDVAITSSFKLELVLNILLGQLTDLLGVHAADILIFQADLQTFRYSCGRGFNTSIPQQTYLRKADSYANQAAQERRMIKIPRLDERADGAKIYPKITGEDFSSYHCLPLLAKGLVKGVLELFHRGEFDMEPEEESFLEMVGGQAAIAIDNAGLFEGLQATNDELILAYNDTLTGWARTLELRDRETAGEAQRLADATVRLAQSLGAGENDLVLMYRGAILHDIGIMGIPDSILLKPAPLTDVEWTVVRKHPQHAHDLLSPINYLRSALDIPYCHHEKWDGSGYPRGLKGAQIPLAARIFAVVDVWDALRSDRPYRRAWTDSEAREYIRQQSGTHFDPAVVQAFLEMSTVP